jgi:hypothetical protein
VQQQIAEELGQRVERSETVNLNELFERMTQAELEKYAQDGTLPTWFPVTAGALGSDKPRGLNHRKIKSVFPTTEVKGRGVAREGLNTDDL